MTKMTKKCSTDQRFIRKRNTTYKIHTLVVNNIKKHKIIKCYHAFLLFWEMINNYADDWTFGFVHGLSDSKAEIAEGSSLSSSVGVTKVGVGVAGDGWCGGTESDPRGWGGGGGGGGSEPNCIDRKYLVAACLSCSRSSAVCRLKNKLFLRFCLFQSFFRFSFCVCFFDEVTKIQKYYVIFVSILQGKMSKTEKTGKKIM